MTPSTDFSVVSNLFDPSASLDSARSPFGGTATVSTSSLQSGPSSSSAATIIAAGSSALTVVAASQQNEEERGYLTELFSSEMYDNLFSDLFTSSFEKNPAVPGQHF